MYILFVSTGSSTRWDFFIEDLGEYEYLSSTTQPGASSFSPEKLVSYHHWKVGWSMVRRLEAFPDGCIARTARKLLSFSTSHHNGCIKETYQYTSSSNKFPMEMTKYWKMEKVPRADCFWSRPLSTYSRTFWVSCGDVTFQCWENSRRFQNTPVGKNGSIFSANAEAL